MSKKVTVRELCSSLLDLIDDGYGNHIVELSLHYDNCHHIQPLAEVYCMESKNIDWITLIGSKEF